MAATTTRSSSEAPLCPSEALCFVAGDTVVLANFGFEMFAQASRRGASQLESIVAANPRPRVQKNKKILSSSPAFHLYQFTVLWTDSILHQPGAFDSDQHFTSRTTSRRHNGPRLPPPRTLPRTAIPVNCTATNPTMARMTRSASHNVAAPAGKYSTILNGLGARRVSVARATPGTRAIVHHHPPAPTTNFPNPPQRRRHFLKSIQRDNHPIPSTVL